MVISQNGSAVGGPEVLQEMEHTLFPLLSARIPNRHMIDVGAHHGFALEPFLRAGWKVDAFEPVKENREELQKRFGFSSNLIVHSQALSATSGKQELHLALDLEGHPHQYYHSLEDLPEDRYHKKGPSVVVQTESIDDMVEGGRLPRRVGFLKIDAEGHDLKVLKGASKLTSDVISAEYWCEGHPLGKSPSPPQLMIPLVAERGYHNYIVIVHGEGGPSFKMSVFDAPRSSWGNILFFRDELRKVYEECGRYCELMAGKSEPAKAPLLLVAPLLPAKPTFVDVGASTGQFTDLMLRMYPDARTYLFEPTVGNFEELKELYSNRKETRVYNYALSDSEGKEPFFHYGVPETNSLLCSLDQTEVGQRTSVIVRTLDEVLREIGEVGSVHLIKVDTQGCDLRVLRGARETIRRCHPVVVSEAIFSPLYQGQDSYYEILEFMRGCGYQLGGIHNMHSTSFGMLAYADLVFVHEEVFRSLCSFGGPLRFHCLDPMYLSEKNTMLQATCDERLQVINELDQAASERLELVNKLTKTAEDRLRVIEQLDAELRRLEGKG